MIQTGEALHTLIATGLVGFLCFLVGTQFGSINAQKNDD